MEKLTEYDYKGDVKEIILRYCEDTDTLPYFEIDDLDKMVKEIYVLLKEVK